MLVVRLVLVSTCLLISALIGGSAFCDESQTESNVERQMVRLESLRRKPQRNATHRVEAGDILAVFIEGVTGLEGQMPPINFPGNDGVKPSLGFPIPINEKGELPLPLIDKIRVAGMTLEEVNSAVGKAYVDGNFLKAEEGRILVSLARPRQATILVIRRDLGAEMKRTVLRLPEAEADIFWALTRSGGVPSESASDEIMIFSRPREGVDFDDSKRLPRRVPLFRNVGENQDELPPADASLSTGDIVIVGRR